MQIGQKIRAARRSKDLTQEELARAVRISAPRISEYERGVSTPPLKVAFLIAEALGFSLDEVTS